MDTPRFGLSTDAVLAAAEASGPPPFLGVTAALVVAAAVIGYFSVRAKVVPIVGFLIAGVIIGPEQLGIVDDQETVEFAAEVGVIFLLFTIGIEFSLGRLMALRTWIAVGGGVQVGLTVAAVAGACMAFGVDWRNALFTGLLVSLSSTAIVLKLLGDARETTSVRGRLSVALLVFQDLAVVAMVLLVPLLGTGEGGEAPGGLDLVVALGTAAAIILVVLVGARRLMPPLLELIARTCSPEVFLLSVLAICFGTAYVTSLAGVSVSLGAFLAGLIVSESRLSSQALAEILPLQILFSAVFFVSVGMLLDVQFVLSNLPLVLGLVSAVIVVKILTGLVAASVLRVGVGTSVGVALLLAQIGEFSFVLATAGQDVGLSAFGLGDDGAQAFIAASVVLLLLTPLFAAAGRRADTALTARFLRRQDARGGELGGPAAGSPAGDHDGAEPDGRRDQILLSGWGPATRRLARELRARGVGLTVVTLSPTGATEAADDGHRVVIGDSTKAAVLQEGGIARSRLVVVAEDDSEQAVRIAGVVANLPRDGGVPVVARPLGGADLGDLSRAGVERVVDADATTQHALLKAVLLALDGDGGPVPVVVVPGSPSPDGSGTVDMYRIVRFVPAPGVQTCAHLDAASPVLPDSVGCEECLREGQRWVHLRVCLECGAVGCCDSSPGRHARAHAATHDHPVIASAEPGEYWAYCYVDRLTAEGVPPRSAAVMEPSRAPGS